MRRNMWIYGMIAITALFAACGDCIRGEGEPITQLLELDQISSITVGGSHDISIAQGNEQKIEITAPQNIIELINKNVSLGSWEIKFDNCVRSSDIQIQITVPDLKSIRIAGSGNVKGLNNLNFQELNLSIAGSGDMELTVNTGKINSSILGSGNIRLKGSSLNHNISIQGSGDIKAGDFETVNTKVEIIGSGDADIFATELIEANITGSGDIRYKDTGVRITADVKGSGELSRK
jgi:hypothetical protein